MNGIIVVNKTKGFTSRDVVNELCHIFNTKSVGHIGTLDPIAEGILVCLIGKYTKLSDIMVNHDKEYIASFKLGFETDTLDITGKTVKKSKLISSEDEIKKVVNSFCGSYYQEVPIYSSVKIKGKKLYEYARNNEIVELPKRMVNIYSIEVIDITLDIVKIKCKVSKGTYIRSLIRDIGEKLGCYATMTELIRTKLDKFDISDSYTIENIKDGNYELLDVDSVLDIVYEELNDIDYKHVKNGNLISRDNGNYILFKYKSKSIALYRRINEKELKPLIMF